MRGTQLAVIGVGRIAAAAPLGFLIGLSLGTLGGGGSILAVPALVYGAGEEAKAATTTSLVVVGTTALVGMFGHLHAGRVRLVPGLAFGIVGIGGSFVGSLLNREIPGDVLLLAFSGLILVAAWRMHVRQPAKSSPASAEPLSAVPTAIGGAPAGSDAAGFHPSARPVGAPRPWLSHTRSSQIARVVAAGTVVGFLTGFFGVGGGFVIVPALVLALGYEMPIAVGTSLLVIAVSSVEGLAFRLPTESVDWRVAVPFTLAGVVGVLLGNRIAGRVPAARLTRWFVWLLVAVAAYTAVQSILAL